MFSNIGDKIKALAEMVAWVGIVISVIFGVCFLFSGYRAEDMSVMITGILVALIGSLVSWVSTFVLYGFGQLIENSDILVKKLAPNDNEEENLEITDEIVEQVGKEYAGSSWENCIHDLSDEELQERMDSKDWQDEYRILCKKELERRK